MNDSESITRPVSDSPVTISRWWLYVAWVKTKNTPPLHVYGFAAPGSSFSVLPDAVYKLPSGAELVISQRGFTEAEPSGASLLQAIRACMGEIDLSAFIKGAPRIKAKHWRRVFCAFPGHSAAQSLAAYGMPTLPHDLPSDQDLPLVLKTISDETGIELSRRQVAHLGGFDLFELGKHLDAPSNFRYQLYRLAEDSHDSLLCIWRVRDDPSAWSVHIELSGDGEVLWEGLKTAKESGSVEVVVQGIADGVKFTVFDGDGTLVQKEECAYVREVGMNAKTLGRTLEVKDKLANQAASQGKTHAYASGSVATSTHASTVAYDPAGLRRFRLQMRDHLEQVIPVPGADRWFHRSLDGQLGVISYLNQLLNDGSIQSAVIVDPFFADDSVERLLTRLSSDSLQLTIVSCWGKYDLNTGKALSEKDSELLLKRVLPAMLDRIGPLLSIKLRFVNLVTGGGDPAFHDRYLMTRSRTGDRQVYLLSNSINNLAVNWPFCMSKLSGQARVEAARYIDGLCLGNDATESTTTKINFEWPAPQGPLP